MAEFIELNDPDINKFSSFLLDNTNKNEEETKEEISIETGNNDAKYDQIFTLDNGRAITQEDLSYYNNNPLVPAPKHIQDLREQLETNPNKVNVNSDPWLEDALQEDDRSRREKFEDNRDKREAQWESNAKELGMSRYDYVENVVGPSMKSEESAALNAWLEYMPGGANFLINLGDDVGWGTSAFTDGVEAILDNSEEGLGITSSIINSIQNVESRRVINPFDERLYMDSGNSNAEIADQVSKQMGSFFEFLAVSPATIPLQASTKAMGAYRVAANQTKQAERILKNPKELKKLTEQIEDINGIFSTILNTEIKTVDDVLDAQTTIKLNKIEKNYLGLYLGNEKNVRAERLRAAQLTASKNPEVMEELILEFEFKDGKRIRDISRRNEDGNLVVDPKKIREEGKKLLKEKQEWLDNDGVNLDDLDLLDSENPLLIPILEPDKLTAMTAVISELKVSFPKSFQKNKPNIDSIFELLIKGDLTEEGIKHNTKLRDIMTKYNLSLDDYILMSIGSASDAGRVLQKFRAIKEAGVRSTSKTKKDIAKENKEVAAYANRFFHAAQRVEGVRRGALVSNIFTAARNYQSMLIRNPIEGLHNVIESAILMYAEKGLKEAGKAYNPFAAIRDKAIGAKGVARDNYGLAFKHIGYIYSRPDLGMDFTKLLLDRPKFLKEFSRLTDNLNEILTAKGRGKGGVFDTIISPYEDFVNGINIFNRTQEQWIRQGVVIAEMERLVKRHYGLDFLDVIRGKPVNGKKYSIPDFIDDSPALVPKGQPSFVNLIDSAVHKALRNTYGAAPDLPIFRRFTNFLTRNLGTAFIPFPRYLFTNLELLSQNLGGGFIPLFQFLTNKVFLPKGKPKYDVVSEKNRQRIANHIIGLTIVGTAFGARQAGVLSSVDPTKIESDVLEKTFGKGSMDISLVGTNVVPLIYLGNVMADIYEGGGEYAAKKFDRKKFMQTITGTLFRAGAARDIVDDLLDRLEGVNLDDGNAFARIFGSWVGSYTSGFFNFMNQGFDAQRYFNWRTQTKKETRQDISGLNAGETFKEYFLRPYRSKGMLDSPSDERNYPDKIVMGKGYTDTDRLGPVDRGNVGAKLFLGSTLEEQENFVEKYLLEVGIPPYTLGQKSQLVSVQTTVNEYINNLLPSIILNTYSRERDVLIPEYRSKTEEYKKANPYKRWRFSIIQEDILNQVAKHRDAMTKVSKNNKIALKYKNTKKNIFILSQQYRKIPPRIKDIVQQDFEEEHRREVDTSKETDLEWLIKESKRRIYNR